MTTIQQTAIDAALNSKTEELPEGVQYVLIRGLSAIGWELPAAGSWDIMQAAILTALPHLGEPPHWVKTALVTLAAYEDDYGEKLPDLHEIGRIDESRRSPSFRFTVEHLRSLASPAPAVKVKPLIWSPRNDTPQYEVCADTPFGRYKIATKGQYGFGWCQPRQYSWSGFLPTLNEAKAAAQSDYEARILSAIEIT